VTIFVTVPFRKGVIRVVIDVKLTSLVRYVTFVTGHHSALTVSWITKQQFVGVAVVENLLDVLEELVGDVVAFPR
jgi:hypothetical protein